MIYTIKDLILADVTGFLVQVFFAVTICLMIFDKQKPPIATSLLTGIALIVLGAGGSLKASLVGWLSMVDGVLWLILAWQRYRQSKN